MGEMIEIMRERKSAEWTARAARWANREEWFAAIRAAGHEPKVLSEENRHCRVNLRGSGWFDFWPSSGKWCQSKQPSGKPQARGNGLHGLLRALP